MITDWVSQFKDSASRTYTPLDILAFQCRDSDIDMSDLLVPALPDFQVTVVDQVQERVVMTFLEEVEAHLAQEIVDDLIRRVK